MEELYEKLENGSDKELEKVLTGTFKKELEKNVSALLKDERLFQKIEDRIAKQEIGTERDPLCAWFYEWYTTDSSDSQELAKFVLCFVPSLLSTYLLQLSTYHKNLIGIEVLLVGIYNVELQNKTSGKEKQHHNWTSPSLTLSSIYKRDGNSSSSSSSLRGHKTGSSGDFSSSKLFTKSNLTETNLKSLEQKHDEEPPEGTQARLPIDFVGSRQRETLVYVALQQFTSHLSSLPIPAIDSFCKMCVTLTGNGFGNGESEEQEEEKPKEESVAQVEKKKSTATEKKPSGKAEEDEEDEREFLTRLGLAGDPKRTRIALSPPLLQVLLDGVNLALHKRKTKHFGERALKAVHTRATYDLLPDVMLKANALVHLAGLDQQKQTSRRKGVNSESQQASEVEN